MGIEITSKTDIKICIEFHLISFRKHFDGEVNDLKMLNKEDYYCDCLKPPSESI